MRANSVSTLCLAPLESASAASRSAWSVMGAESPVEERKVSCTCLVVESESPGSLNAACTVATTS